jgi:MFS family permease
MGLGAGLVFAPCTTAVGIHFRRRRSLAVGMALTGGSVGAIVFPIGRRILFLNANVLLTINYNYAYLVLK